MKEIAIRASLRPKTHRARGADCIADAQGVQCASHQTLDQLSVFLL